MDKDVVIIGVDGGATEVKAHAVSCDSLENPTSFELRSETASRKYARLAEFEPMPVVEQLPPRSGDQIELSENEKAQGQVWISATAEAVVEVFKACGAKKALVGQGMPGLKTPDGRGISVINNGPRMPYYLEDLQRLLAEAGVELLGDIARLGSDADYCGLGELHAAEGVFRGVDNAYYVGCGTGVADAMKLGGKLVTFDESKAWLQKSWQISSALGATFEKLISAKSMNDCYGRLVGVTAGGESRFPEIEAVEGNALALGWMDCVALVLAELIFERINTVKNGRADAGFRSATYAELEVKHPYSGTVLDRVVIGQRLGQIYGDSRYAGVFGEKLDGYLASLLKQSGDKALMDGCLEGDKLRSGFVVASKLRAAPALGAAVAAVQAYGGAEPAARR